MGRTELDRPCDVYKSRGSSLRITTPEPTVIFIVLGKQAEMGAEGMSIRLASLSSSYYDFFVYSDISSLSPYPHHTIRGNSNGDATDLLGSGMGFPMLHRRSSVP